VRLQLFIRSCQAVTAKLAASRRSQRTSHRRRIPWAFLTRLLGLITALFALTKKILELWICTHTGI
jgi:hypothetical protein